MSNEIISKNRNILQRLNSTLELRGLKPHGKNTKVAEKTGYSVSQVHGILSGKSTLSDRFLKTVCREYSISEDYVRTGQGAAFTSDPSPSYGEENAFAHRDSATEREADRLRSGISVEGDLNRKEQQVVKMFRYLEQNDRELAQETYERIVEAFLDAQDKKA